MTQQTPLQPNIDQIRDLLSPYLDGEVTDTERRQVETALAASAELQAELNALQNTVALLAALPDMPAPRPFTLTEADVAEFSHSSLREKNRFRIPTWLWGLGTAAAAMICILAAGGILFSAQFGGSNSAPAAEVAMQQEAAAPDTNLAEGEVEAASGKVAPAVEEKAAAEPPLTAIETEPPPAAPPAPEAEVAAAEAEQAAPSQPAGAAEESGAEQTESFTADTVEELNAAEAAPPADAADDTAMLAAPPAQESAKRLAGAAQAEESQKEEATGLPAETPAERSAAQAPLQAESLKETATVASEDKAAADADQSGPLPQQTETEFNAAPQLTTRPTPPDVQAEATPTLVPKSPPPPESPFSLWQVMVVLLTLGVIALVVTGIAVVLLRRKR